MANSTAGDAGITVLLAIAFVSLMIGFVWSLLRSRFGHDDVDVSQDAMALVMMGLLSSALVTEAIGIRFELRTAP